MHFMVVKMLLLFPAIQVLFGLTLDLTSVREQCETLLKEGETAQLLSFLQNIEETYGGLDLDKDLPSLYNYKGVALYESNKLVEAEEVLTKAVEHIPEDLRAWMNLVELRLYIRKPVEAQEALKVVESLGDWEYLVKHFKYVTWKGLEYKLFKEEVRAIECLDRGEREKCSNNLLPISDFMYLNGTKLRLLTEFLFAGENFTRKSADFVTEFKPYRIKNKLVIGVILSQLDATPVPSLIQHFFKSMASTKLISKLFLLRKTKSEDEKWKREMLKSFDKVISLEGLGVKEAARSIANEKIDILIDINGISLHNGMILMSFKPSQIQQVFLGEPRTSGAPYLDYFITDAVQSPPELVSSHFTEKLGILPTCNIINSHKSRLHENLKKVRKSKTEFLGKEGVPRNILNEILFAAYHGVSKLDPTVLQIWTNILRRMPPSSLVFRNQPSVKNFNPLFHSLGSGRNRLWFLNDSAWVSHHYEKSVGDIFLETLVKNGHTTTIDAVWSGLPVIALGGQNKMSKRSAESVVTHSIPSNIHTNHVSNLTKTDFFPRAVPSSHGIVYSLKEYEDLAVSLAKNHYETHYGFPKGENDLNQGNKKLVFSQEVSRLDVWRGLTDGIRGDSPVFDTNGSAKMFFLLQQGIFEAHQIGQIFEFPGKSRRNSDGIQRKVEFHVFMPSILSN